MALSQTFGEAMSGAAVNVFSLYVDTCYPVLHAERVETEY
jgi:hypothetical protein